MGFGISRGMRASGSIALSLGARGGLWCWPRSRSGSASAPSWYGVIFVMNLDAMPRRDLGSNGQGTAQWWQQRVSAMALVPLIVWFVIVLVSVPIADPASVVRWIRGGINALLLVALVLAAAQHSYHGTRVIVDDYVSSLKGRVATVVILQFMHTVLAAAGVLSVLRVALGA